MAELKRCPFCGGEAVLAALKYGDGHIYFGIVCDSWGCPSVSIIPSYDSEQEAIEAWNRRSDGNG